LPIDQVLARYPEIATVADVMPVPFRSVGSTAIGPPEWLEVERARAAGIVCARYPAIANEAK
jgi:hypothetical protein